MEDDREDGSEDGAARAFAQLGREVSLLRAAIEGLTAARNNIEIPDYEPTLARTEKILAALAQRIDAMGKSAAMTLTPEAMGQRLNAVLTDTTRELRHQIGETDRMLRNVGTGLADRLESARTRDQQTMWLLRAGLGGSVLGLLLYALLAGPVARLAPASWQWPERVATRVLGEPSPWDAGQRLMRVASPASWTGIISGNRIVTANKDTLEACRKAAAKTKKPVRCAIEVKAGE